MSETPAAMTVEELLEVPVKIHTTPPITREVMLAYLKENGYEYKMPVRQLWGSEPAWEVYGKEGHRDIDVPLEPKSWFLRSCSKALGKTELRVWYELVALKQTGETPSNDTATI